jgi:hypothetical protein
LSDIDAPNGYTLSGSGSGGAAGMVKGGAKVRLVQEADATVLHYEAHAQVAGKLAQIGSRLVDMAAKKMADDFFGNFVRQLESVAPAENPAAAAATVVAPVQERQPVPETISHKRLGWLVWVLVALVVILLAARFKGLF